MPEEKWLQDLLGCVRKYLSNEKIDDIDIATTLTTDQ